MCACVFYFVCVFVLELQNAANNALLKMRTDSIPKEGIPIEEGGGLNTVTQNNTSPVAKTPPKTHEHNESSHEMDDDIIASLAQTQGVEMQDKNPET